jgi:FKBP-type peptidyl-prolyl cis-trans isomerase SlyD
MIIENKTVVSLNYRLTTKENDVEVQVEKTDPAHPFVFLFGAGGLLPDFERNLAGKAAGDAFDFFISAENGYGLSNEKNFVDMPMDAFCDDEGIPNLELLQVGKVLFFNDQSGRQHQGRVQEIKDETVLMDFNHPLADRELHFTGEVASVRKASEEELSHGHVHGAGGHHH